MSHWATKAQESFTGQRVFRNERELREWTKYYDLVFIDAPDIRRLVNFADGDKPTPLGRKLVLDAHGLLIVGSSNDERNEAVLDWAAFAIRKRVQTLAAMDVGCVDRCIYKERLKKLENDGGEVFLWQRPDHDNVTDMFRTCVSDRDSIASDPLGCSIDALARSLTSSLGWPEALASPIPTWDHHSVVRSMTS